MSNQLKNDPDAIVVQISQKVVEEIAPVAPGAEGSEPEIIGQKEKEAAEEEAKK